MEVFELRNLCVAWSGKPVVSDLCLSAPSPGALSLIGPPGAGKSSVLGAVAGAHGLGMSVSGEAVLDGIPCDALLRGSGWWRQPLGIDMDRAAALSRGRAAHEAWSAQRLWALHDCIATGHELYVLDEPTAGLAGEDAARARGWLAALARRAFVLMATRSRGDCLAVGGTAVLFDAGAVVEEAPAMDLFVRPRTPAGRHYAATGNLAGLHPRTRPVGVDGIWWVVPKLLCGLSRPGLVAPVEWQYRQLADAGVRHLVSLEERVPDVEARHAGSTLGLALHHFPVVDGAAPALEQASGFCRLAAEAIRAGHGLAFHCRSGLGRTATALVAVLVWQGEPLEVAIAKVRAAQGCAIRSAAQRQFLREFATHLDALKASSQTLGE